MPLQAPRSAPMMDAKNSAAMRSQQHRSWEERHGSSCIPAIRFAWRPQRARQSQMSSPRRSRDARRRHQPARARDWSNRRPKGEPVVSASTSSAGCSTTSSRRTASIGIRAAPAPSSAACGRERRAGHGRIAQAREAAGRYRPGLRSAGQQARSAWPRRPSKPATRSRRATTTIMAANLLGLGDVDRSTRSTKSSKP